MSGAALQVLLELLRQNQGLEGCVEFDFPRPKLGRVQAFACVMLRQPLF
jgi:hypothetical protein